MQFSPEDFPVELVSTPEGRSIVRGPVVLPFAMPTGSLAQLPPWVWLYADPGDCQTTARGAYLHVTNVDRLNTSLLLFGARFLPKDQKTTVCLTFPLPLPTAYRFEFGVVGCKGGHMLYCEPLVFNNTDPSHLWRGDMLSLCFDPLQGRVTFQPSGTDVEHELPLEPGVDYIVRLMFAGNFEVPKGHQICCTVFSLLDTDASIQAPDRPGRECWDPDWRIPNQPARVVRAWMAERKKQAAEESKTPIAREEERAPTSSSAVSGPTHQRADSTLPAEEESQLDDTEGWHII